MPKINQTVSISLFLLRVPNLLFHFLTHKLALVDKCLPCRKFIADFSLSWDFSEHPWVTPHLIYVWSLGRIEIHHFLEKVLKLHGVDVTTILSTSMDLPEDFTLIGGKIVVDGVNVWVCACERQSLREQSKEYNRRGEKVDICT